MRLRRLYSHVLTHNWLAVALDFVIVVLGVYVAVWAGNLQASHERRQRTEKVVAALRQDLRDTIAVEDLFDKALDGAFSAFESARQRGEAPPPVFCAFQAPTRRRRARARACSRLSSRN